MLHIIQENLFKEEHYDILIKTIQRLQLPYHIVRVYPFVDRIVDINDIPEKFNTVEDLPEINPSGKIWCWGSLSMTRIAKTKRWKPGTMVNDNHNYEVYSKWWKDMLLNYDSELMTIGDKLPWYKGSLFLRPVKDSKAFTGAIFNEEKWKYTVQHYINEPGYPEFNKDTVIQVSMPKEIQREIRLWIVGDKIITGSYYKLGNRFYLDDNVEEEAIKFGYKVIEKGKLADAWVLDICMFNDEWKIVEAGCINHAGFYKSNLGKLVEEIEYYFDS